MTATQAEVFALFVSTAAFLSIFRYIADIEPSPGSTTQAGWRTSDGVAAAGAFGLAFLLIFDRGELSKDAAQSVVNFLSRSDYPVRRRYVRQAVVAAVILGDYLGVCSYLRRHGSDWQNGFVYVVGSLVTALMVGLTVDTQALFSAGGLLAAPMRDDLLRIVLWLSVIGAIISVASYTRLLNERLDSLVGATLGLVSGCLVVLAVFHANVVVVSPTVDPGVIEGPVVGGWTALATFLAIGWSIGMVGLVIGAICYEHDPRVFYPVAIWCLGVVPLIWFVTYQMTYAELGIFGEDRMLFPSNWLPLTWFPAAIAAAIVWHHEIT